MCCFGVPSHVSIYSNYCVKGMLLANLHFLLLTTNDSRSGGVHEIEQLVIECQRKEDNRELLCNLTFYVLASIINNLDPSEPSNSVCHETRVLTQGKIELNEIYKNYNRRVNQFK